MYLLLTGNLLNAVPPPIQRFRIRLTLFDFSISYVPGVTLKTVDVLAHFSLSATDDNTAGGKGYIATVINLIATKDTHGADQNCNVSKFLCECRLSILPIVARHQLLTNGCMHECTFS